MDAADAFVEELAQWFEHSGMPRISGRIVAYLLVCEPAHQSADQLVAALHASRGSISTATRMLTTAGLVERVTFRGDRRTYHRARPDWNALLEVQLARISELRRLLERGRAAVPHSSDRLDSVNQFASFWETELTDVLRRATSA